MFWLEERAQGNQLRSWMTPEHFAVNFGLCFILIFTDKPSWFYLSFSSDFTFLLLLSLPPSLSCNKKIRLHFHNYSGQRQILQQKIHGGKGMLWEIPNASWKLEMTWNHGNNSMWENFIYHKYWTLLSGALHLLCKNSHFHKPLVVQEQSEKDKERQKIFERADS